MKPTHTYIQYQYDYRWNLHYFRSEIDRGDVRNIVHIGRMQTAELKKR